MGNVPSNIRDVIVFPSPAKPAKRSSLVLGAKDKETSLDPINDFAALSLVRARKKAVVDVLGAVGVHWISRTAKR